MDNELYDSRKNRVLAIIQDKNYTPLKFKELVQLLQVEPEDKPVLKDILKELEEDGKIMMSARGKYQLLDNDYWVGVFEGHTKGFGFISVEGEKEDYFVSADATNGALHKDKVLFKITKVATENSGKRKEAVIIKILQRGCKTLVGTYQKNKSFGFVVPDSQRFNKDIFIPKKFTSGAVNGHKVVVKITDFGDNDRKPEGKITEIIGHINDPGTDIMSIVKAYELPMEFNDKVMNQLESILDEVGPEDMDGRMDLRNIQTVTIDGEDAKDLDDAITISKNGDIYQLGVHIADVTNYVTEGSPLDKEALKRGTSVYLVDRVIPMLPHKLSNGICSLNEGVDRLALSCIMDIDMKGKIVGHQIAETIINVDRRMSYTDVNKVIIGDECANEEYADFVSMFINMKELADILRKNRHKRGSVDFDFPESKIILDKNGKPINIYPYDRNDATKIIEDFMLKANETIAEDYFWQEIPFEYRTHEAPDTEKIDKLSVLINNFGYYFKTTSENIHPKEFQKLLEKIEGEPEEPLISRLTLRSMKQARYTSVCSGHFGLAAKYYCHFTSPIRRYPDLQIHRIIKENLNGKLNGKRRDHYDKILPQVSEDNSKKERRAEEAEREVIKLKKVQYMSERIGNVYEGIISSITAWGIYVELPNTIEGMIHVTSLYGDYYFYDESKYVMIGRDSGIEYKLGQRVKIKVIKTDKLTRTIDFEIYEDDDEELM